MTSDAKVLETAALLKKEWDRCNRLCDARDKATGKKGKAIEEKVIAQLRVCDRLFTRLAKMEPQSSKSLAAMAGAASHACVLDTDTTEHTAILDTILQSAVRLGGV